ncbi:MAG: hypothetical protein JW727_01285 [Candidatus Aenigmarchaeota archaeon]|nr:hypothetical protein [Candidatus Aenigmarchaeota archaeon]
MVATSIMKGIAKGMASWIWVVGSVLFGLMIFFAGYVLISGQIQSVSDRLILDEVTNLQNSLRSMCVSKGTGAYEIYDISLPENIKAVYVAKADMIPAPDKVSVMISENKSAIGNFFCYQLAYTDTNLPKKCWESRCDLNFTYIGTPSMKTTLSSRIARIMGSNPTYNYRLSINKTGEHSVLVTAETLIK